jgi:hypothetical protein
VYVPSQSLCRERQWTGRLQAPHRRRQVRRRMPPNSIASIYGHLTVQGSCKNSASVSKRCRGLIRFSVAAERRPRGMGERKRGTRDIGIDQNQGWGPAPYPLLISASILAISPKEIPAVPPHELLRISCRCRRQVHAGVPAAGPGGPTERWTSW